MTSSKSASKFKVLDVFGASTGFLIDGSQTHRTYLGAFFSLLVFLFVFIYSSQKTLSLAMKDDTEYSSKVMTDSLDFGKAYTNDEIGTRLVFLATILKFDESYGVSLQDMLEL